MFVLWEKTLSLPLVSTVKYRGFNFFVNQIVERSLNLQVKECIILQNAFSRNNNVKNKQIITCVWKALGYKVQITGLVEIF